MSYGSAPKLPISGGLLMDLSFPLGVLGWSDSDPLELIASFDGRLTFVIHDFSFSGIEVSLSELLVGFFAHRNLTP